MATVETFVFDCYDTALCIIPPSWTSIDRLRALYDKAYGKWPPHINLVYPFVCVDALPKAVEAVRKAAEGESSFAISLSSAGVLQHRHDNTVFIKPRDGNGQLQHLRQVLLRSLGGRGGSVDYQPHMTIGQTEDAEGSWHNFLVQKVNLLPEVQWQVDRLYVLTREPVRAGESFASRMRTWATISVGHDRPRHPQQPMPLPLFYHHPASSAESEDDTENELQSCLSYSGSGWKPSSHHGPAKQPESLRVATYNVLAEFHYPPSQDRYSLLVDNILADAAATDVLVLQEVTDHFLSYLLGDPRTRDAFAFTSHGPPDQADIDPLPSHNNILVLSRFAFDWRWVSCQRLHKGSLIIQFRDIGLWDDTDLTPLIMAAAHLTSGLKDGAVTAKKLEVQQILKHLDKSYPEHPTIVMGDFNISTSAYTIDQALGMKSISPQGASQLRSLDTILADHGFLDTWTVSRLERGAESDDEVEEAFEGEQGATYDPTVNSLAAQIVGSGFNMRPQRYDRVLVKSGFFKTLRFNKFGFLTGEAHFAEGKDAEPKFASDHWGVRTILKLESDQEHQQLGDDTRVLTVRMKKAPGLLSRITDMSKCLERLHAVPSETEIENRSAIFDLLRGVILETWASHDSASQGRPGTSLVVVPVGSYGLGVWTVASDIDCLCLGTFSSKTFFTLVMQRLRKAADKGVKVLRRVKAHSGTMFELEVQGIKIDLQYCSATTVAERWPAVLKTPASDPVWSLPAQTLLKIKSVRDLDYLRRSIPDIAQFRLAHRLIKTWAKSRGVYTAKFGYLGGIHISVLLVRICKFLARDAVAVSVGDILVTFFNHYSTVDWARSLLFDPFFHTKLPRYRRTPREPLAILGYFPPGLNLSQAAPLASARTIAEEFRRADKLLSGEGMTWAKFLGVSGTGDVSSVGAAEFLWTFKSFIRIDVQFWGGSLTKGRSFVGWLESRCVMILVDIDRRLPNLHARIWPARFVEEASEKDEDGDFYQGCYLIGLDKLDESVTSGDLKIALGTLRTILARFEERIHSDEKYFDTKSSWMSASIVNKTDLGCLEVDGREWGEYTIGDDESEEEEEEEEGVLADEEREPRTSRKTAKKQGRSAIVPKPGGAGKFRTAVAVMNRLRWDPALDSNDYIVGYEDRFVGAREKALETWKTEQTDEEFIPQHRVLYFKRRSDGVVVWERKTRKDDLFGSGI